MLSIADTASIAGQMVRTLDEAALVELPSERYPGIDFGDAYRVGAEASRLRVARGERTVGRKIGYTNRNIWAQYNIDQPIWGHVYDRTLVHAADNEATISLARMVAPRIEPEIAFKLRGPVPVGCDDPAEVLASVEWMARAFEVVDCHYADWKFQGPDSVIDFAHHAALVVGEAIEVHRRDRALVETMRECGVRLLKGGDLVDSGTGANALGHPLTALAFLADVVASQPEAPSLAAGEVVTTGTLTAAMPVARGESWRTETEGLAFPALNLGFE